MKFRILSMDGGGSKGVYTIGILEELESFLGSPLSEHFELVYGTSTGAILAALIGLGLRVSEVKHIYLEYIPYIMAAKSAGKRSDRLEQSAAEIFKSQYFDEFKIGVGIVSMNYDTSKHVIFKNDYGRAFAGKHSFVPGFGCTIADAVIASSAAYPIFRKKPLSTTLHGDFLAVDGGFVANNPVLFAITDAVGALNLDLDNISVVSLGTGNFMQKSISLKMNMLRKLGAVQLFEKVLEANTSATESLVKYLFPALEIIRINNSYVQVGYATNMVDCDMKTLKRLLVLGKQSFAVHENDIRTMFKS